MVNLRGDRFHCVSLAVAVVLSLSGGCGDDGGGDNTPADLGPRPECDYVHDDSLSDGEPAALAGTTEAHNAWRFRVGSAPLAWDEGIADHAQEWADHLAETNNCGLEHSSNAQRANIAGFSSLGQNLAGSSGGLSGTGATANWAAERSEYDFGTVINPLLVEGQVRGALVQGLGAALSEELRYDAETGQLINGSMMDYFAPSCSDVPKIELLHTEVPSTATTSRASTCRLGAIWSATCRRNLS